MKKKSPLVLVEISLAVILWAGSFVASKIALRDAAPMTVVWLRFTLGVIVLGIAVFRRSDFEIPAPRDLAYYAFIGLEGITFHQWLQTTGLQTAQATTSAWIVATSPIFIALLGWFFLKEKLGGLRVTGIALAMVGVLLVVTRGNLASLVSGHFGTTGDILVMISAPNWAVFSVLSRYGLRKQPATRMMFLVMVFGWLFNTILLLAGPGFSDLAHLSLDGWLAVGFLGIFCSGLAYLFYYNALQAIPASQVGAFLYGEPLVTVIVAGILLGEMLSVATMLGGAIILFGVWLVNRPSHEPQGAVSIPATHPKS